MVNFDVSKHDAKQITKIVVRACSLLNLESHGSSRLYLAMDLTACHANGNPLDLERLLSVDNFNFTHDVLGIIHHLDRNTGTLKDFFCPRLSIINMYKTERVNVNAKHAKRSQPKPRSA